MKKLILAVFLMLALCIPAFAQVDIDGPSTSGSLSPIGGVNAQAGATSSATGGNATINDNSRITNSNTNLNTDVNTNINTFNPTNIQGQNQGQSQGQMQGQGQLQGQGQMNNWSQTYNAPRDLLSAPAVTPPEIPIIKGKMWVLTSREIPNIGIPLYNGEEYVAAKSYNGSIFNRVRREDLAEDLLIFRDKILGKVGWAKSKVRIEVIGRDAGESTSTSGAGAGSGSWNPTNPSGVAGTAGLFPGKTRWKQDDQYTIVFYLIK